MAGLLHPLRQASHRLRLLAGRSISALTEGGVGSQARAGVRTYFTRPVFLEEATNSAGPSGRAVVQSGNPQGSLSAWKWLLGGGLAVAGAAALYASSSGGTSEKGATKDSPRDEQHAVSNWSGTHVVHPKIFLQPESTVEVERLVAEAHEKGQKLRPMGSGLSPNGIGLSEHGLLSLALCDKVLEVDKKKGLVRVEAGARVSQLVEELAQHGLTLQNYASIQEQQIAGFTQVGAHGTGAKIPSVDEQVVAMKLVTPAKGILELSKDKDPELFYLARCGLGALGVVTEVTIQCVPAHKLVEKTWVASRSDVHTNHSKWLKQYQHLRYMWVPLTDSVVVVGCNPEGKERGWLGKVTGQETQAQRKPEEDCLQHVRKLFHEVAQEKPSRLPPVSDTELEALSFTELRDKLLAADPLSVEHVAKVNAAEAEYWKLRAGSRVGWSNEILQFDCGGQQWVMEVAFPAGALSKLSLADLEFMDDVLGLIEKEKIPAHSPIEQRWTAGSASPMSPSHSPPGSPADAIHSWVGIIMYLPFEDAARRMMITHAFESYTRKCETKVWPKYGAVEHWAKLEVPENGQGVKDLERMRARLRQRYPVDKFNEARKTLDPKGILSNDVVEKLLGDERTPRKLV